MLSQTHRIDGRRSSRKRLIRLALTSASVSLALGWAALETPVRQFPVPNSLTQTESPMLSHDFLHGQNHYKGRIGIEQPMANFKEDFETIFPLRTRMMPDFLDLSNDGHLDWGTTVPIIYGHRNNIHFTTTHWGRHEMSKDHWEYVRKCEQIGIGRPALIPATYFDIIFESAQEDGSIAARLRGTGGRNLYVGAMYWVTPENVLFAVTPLIVEAGPDVARYSDWQPLLIPTTGPPLASKPGVEMFLSTDSSIAFQRPSLRWSVNVELLHPRKSDRVRKSAAICA
jgi:hypothetical protein